MNDSRRQPIFNVPGSVLVMLAILIAIHVVRQFISPEFDSELLFTGSFIPARYGEGGEQLPGGELARWTSPFTYMLLHADFMHLAMNSVWLLAFGAPVAKRLGGLGFWLFSILCGVVGIGLHQAFNWGTLAVVIGASGAVSGMTAAALRFYFAALRMGNAGVLKEHPKAVPLTSIPAMLRDPQILVVIGVWLLLNIGFGFAGSYFTGGQGIAWQTHIGGFLAGLFLFGQFDRLFSPAPRSGADVTAAGDAEVVAPVDDDDEDQGAPPPAVTYH